MVERNLAKVDVARSNRVTRLIKSPLCLFSMHAVTLSKFATNKTQPKKSELKIRQKAFKFKLKSTNDQFKKLNRTAGCVRLVSKKSLGVVK